MSHSSTTATRELPGDQTSEGQHGHTRPQRVVSSMYCPWTNRLYFTQSFCSVSAPWRWRRLATGPPEPAGNESVIKPTGLGGARDGCRYQPCVRPRRPPVEKNAEGEGGLINIFKKTCRRYPPPEVGSNQYLTLK